MGYIYISYSHKDGDFVQKLAGTLEQEGFDVWVDERLDYGSDWPMEIQKQLDYCDALILVMSPRSQASKWVQNELNRALRKEKPIFPLLLEGREPWLSVESIQIIDVTGGIMPDEKLFSRLALVTLRHKKPMAAQPQEADQKGEIEANRTGADEQPDGSREVAANSKTSPIKQGEKKRAVFKKWWLAVAFVILVCLAATLAVFFKEAPGLIGRMKATPSLMAVHSTPVTPQAIAPAMIGSPTPIPMPGPATVPGGVEEVVTPLNGAWEKWTLTRSFPSPGSKPTGVVRIGEAIWVLVPGDKRMYHLDLDGNIVKEFEVSASQGVGSGLAWDGESLWEVSWNGITQFDSVSGKESTQFTADMETVQGITWDGSGLWVIDSQGNLARYDRSGQRLRRLAIPVVAGATGLAWVEGETWVENTFGEMERFDSDFNLLGSFHLSLCSDAGSFYNMALYWDGKSLWMAGQDTNRIYQCTPGD